MLARVRALRRRFEDSARSFGQVFANPNIRRIEGAWAASIMAHWAYGIALAVYAYRDGGAAAVGLVGLVRFLPSAVASPFASVLGDRYRRERVIFVAELVRAVLLAATTAVVVLEGSAGCRLRPCRPGRHRVLGRSSGAGGPAPDRSEDAAGADGCECHLEHDRESRGLRRPRDRRRAPGRDQRAGRVRRHRRGFPARGATDQPRPGRDPARAARAARRRLARVHGRLRHDLPRARASRAGGAARLADVRRRSAQRPDRRHRAPAARSRGGRMSGSSTRRSGSADSIGAIVSALLIGRRLSSNFLIGIVLWGIPIALIGVFPEPAHRAPAPCRRRAREHACRCVRVHAAAARSTRTRCSPAPSALSRVCGSRRSGSGRSWRRSSSRQSTSAAR